jgi:8-oxo-dGTP pyrophosphatase MutT (NUDIX family)
MPGTDRDDDRAPWQVLGKRRLYASRWLNLEHWAVRLPDGHVIPDHHVVDYPNPAVAVVPVGDDGRILMIDHYRFITGTRGWEVPSGGFEPGESVEAAAGRELLEETGHSAATLEVLGRYHPSNGSSNQVFHVAVARGLCRRSDPLDSNETLDLRWFPVEELRSMLLGGAIPDGFTVTALCWSLVAGAIR